MERFLKAKIYLIPRKYPCVFVNHHCKNIFILFYINENNTGNSIVLAINTRTKYFKILF